MMSGWLEALRRPVSSEARARSVARWASLPDRLKSGRQLIGVAHHSCGATHGVMERCDLACTSCYLGKDANAAEPLGRDEVHRQLDMLREFLGPQGKAQITAGEVTLLPREELGGYVRYARHIGLDPMVMTHGRRFLDEPDYLRRLVEEDGLEKISIHVDATQRGREEWSPFVSERELNPLRERYANLVRETRLHTGKKLHAAHTVTLTRRNLDQVGDVMDWMVDNLDAFRMVSFQPVAAVGRTQDETLDELTLDGVWERICAALGTSLNRHAMHFGHPECHIVAPLIVLRAGDTKCVLETARDGKRWDQAFLRRLMRHVGCYTVRGRSRFENLLGIASLTLRNPLLLAEAMAYGVYRGLADWKDWMPVVISALRTLRLEMHPLAVVVHRFMSPGELDSELGRERLSACTFRVPVGSEMISMCELNATDLRSRLYPKNLKRRVV